MSIVLKTDLPLPKKEGKVRDIYDLGDHLLIIATDRISVFDQVLPNGIPQKGAVLTALSTFWFKSLIVSSHYVHHDVQQMVQSWKAPKEVLAYPDRTMLVIKTQPYPVECVVRGFLTGSIWKEYKETGCIFKKKYPPGLKENFPLPEPVFTPYRKSETGHDEEISLQEMSELCGDHSRKIVSLSTELYKRAAKQAFEKGIILADTKFEWGVKGKKLLLIDEAITPDSSRIWSVENYKVGETISSFDKQYVRDYVACVKGISVSLPDDVVKTTTEKYLSALRAITS